jgi:ABC-type branched-subunit amino acid transport system ATPase component
MDSHEEPKYGFLRARGEELNSIWLGSFIMLEIEKLCKHFGGLAALREVSLKVSEGSFIGLIGPNGSGKTTFFNVLTGVVKPTSG